MKLIRASASAWVEDRAPSMGAALSYYTVFSIAPLLLIVIAVAGLVFGADAAQGAIVAQLQGLLGEQAAKTIQDVLVSVSKPKEGILATIVGIAALLIGATTVFAELQDDLDRIWKAPAQAKPSGAWGWIRSRILSFGLILAFGFLLLISLVASASIAALGDWWSPLFGSWEVVAQVVNFVVTFGLITVLFALIFKFMPHVKVQWHDVWVGAVVTAILFNLGKLLIGLYIGKSDIASGFGAAGSLAILLVWVYYSAQVFLYGAEFTRVFAHTFGSRSAVGTEGSRLAIDADNAESAHVYPKAPLPAAMSDREKALALDSGILQRHLLSATLAAAGLGGATMLLLQHWRKRRAAAG